jgi:hypothetical protein
MLRSGRWRDRTDRLPPTPQLTIQVSHPCVSVVRIVQLDCLVVTTVLVAHLWLPLLGLWCVGSGPALSGALFGCAMS